MRLFTELIFDEDVVGTTVVYTSSDFNDLIGQPDVFSVQILGTQVSGASSSTLTVAYEHSMDGRTWEQHSTKSITGINGNFDGIRSFDADTTVHGTLGRLALSFGDTASARVRARLCGRST